MKKVPTAFVSISGLIINGVGNGLFIILVSRYSTPEVTTQTMLIWAAFFVAGACVAPFENLFLYRVTVQGNEVSSGRITFFAITIFGVIGGTLYFLTSAGLMAIITSIMVGWSNVTIVRSRAHSIAYQKLARVSISNSIEGAGRALGLYLFIVFNNTLTTEMVIQSYVLGNLLALIPYRIAPHLPTTDAKFIVSWRKIFGLSLIGFLVALSTGGLPYLSGFFGVTNISIYLLIFTLARSLLIMQTLLTYHSPMSVIKLGSHNSYSRMLISITIASTLFYCCLIPLKATLDFFTGINLESVSYLDLWFYAMGLASSSIFGLKIAAQNSSAEWKLAIAGALVSVATATSFFLVITDQSQAFLLAMSIAPFLGLMTVVHFDRKLLRIS